MLPKSLSAIIDYYCSSSSLLSSSSSSDETTRTYEYKVTRHSYKTTKNDTTTSTTTKFSFEQSLDVYTPTVSSKSTSTTSSSTGSKINNVKQHPDEFVIVLVMGSGWLGHAPWVYYVTNWWNSGGPKQICHKLGYTCISVRHSGGFIHVVPATITNCIVATIVWFMYIVLNDMLLTKSYHNNDIDNDDYRSFYEYFKDIFTTIINGDFDPPYNLFYTMVGIFVSMALMKWFHGPGATLDDMVQDVDDALNYIQSNRKELGLSSSESAQAMILGGYSSGGHVAATWYSRQSNLQSKSSSSFSSDDCDNNNNNKTANLKTTTTTPYDDIIGLLYISGCMSLDSFTMSAVTWTVFNKPRCDIPSPIRHLPTNKSNGKIVVKHLLVGCENETFGLPLLDATFCSKEYVARLLLLRMSSDSLSSSSKQGEEEEEEEKQQELHARYVAIPYANHWTILDSNGLVKELELNLPWLMDYSSSSEASSKRKHHASSVPPASLSTSMSSSMSSSGGIEDNS